MKIEFSSTLGIVIFIALTLDMPCHAHASSRRLPGPFYGACSARLMDTLHTVCGSGGIGLVKNIYLMRRYRPRLFRRNGGHSVRRSTRDLENVESYKAAEESIYQPPKHMTFEEARRFLFRRHSPLSSIVRTGSAMHRERTVKKRVRRQISHECCLNNCSKEFMQRKYCNFRFG